MIANNQNFQEYMKDISQYTLIDIKRERALVEIMRNSKNEEEVRLARDELILANLRLVITYALRLYKNVADVSDVKISLMDLISEGNIALMRAVDLFNPEKYNTRFSTYASLGITRMMKKALQNSRFIRIPSYHVKYLIQLVQLQETYGKDLTDTIALKKLNITPYLLNIIKNEIANNIANFVQLDDIMDLIPSNDKNVVESIIEGETKELLLKLIKEMDIKDQDVLFFKLFGNQHATLQELATKYNVTRQCIDNRLHSALGKLKQKMRKNISLNKG